MANIDISRRAAWKALPLVQVVGKARARLTTSAVSLVDSIALYPCGILEQAYRQLRAQGVPLVRPRSALARKQQREEEGYRNRDKDPTLDPRFRPRQALNDAINKAVHRRLLQMVKAAK
jgi:hypothetical protein